MFESFIPPGDGGSPLGGPDDSLGCLWHIVIICLVALVVIGLMKWLS